LTILGAVGGIPGGRTRFIYKVAKRTNKESVLDFLKHFKRKVRPKKKMLIIYTDNHSAHHSHVVRDYVASTRLDLRFLPAYSSPLSVQERVWSILKAHWAKHMSHFS